MSPCCRPLWPTSCYQDRWSSTKHRTCFVVHTIAAQRSTCIQSHLRIQREMVDLSSPYVSNPDKLKLIALRDDPSTTARCKNRASIATYVGTVTQVPKIKQLN